MIDCTKETLLVSDDKAFYTLEGEGEYVDRLDLGIGYSFNVWNNFYADPNYTISMNKNSDDEYEGNFNLTLSYKF